MCTSMKLTAKDSSHVVGRTMEFPVLMDAELSVVPRGISLSSTAEGGSGWRHLDDRAWPGRDERLPPTRR
jgi:penicillin V acylase-like amidase (Ntn superfamily)